MKKVTWPDSKQTMASTLVVIVFTVVVSIYLFGVDALVHWLINMLLR
jgi:preprotein translocase subunit SecE